MRTPSFPVALLFTLVASVLLVGVDSIAQENASGESVEKLRAELASLEAARAKIQARLDAANTASSGPDPVATVDGVPIPRAELNARLREWRLRMKHFHAEISPDDVTRMTRTFIQQLIDQRLIESRAVREGVTVSSAEVDEGFAAYRATFDPEDLVQSEMSDDELRKLHRMNLLKNRLFKKMDKRPSISQADVAKHFEENNYRTHEMVPVREILWFVSDDAPEAKKQAALNQATEVLRLANEPGADFAALAREHNTLKTRGDVKLVKRGRMETLEDAAFSAVPGRAFGPVETWRGVHVILVGERIAARPYALDEIKDGLLQLLREIHSFDVERQGVAKLRRGVNVVVHEPGVKFDVPEIPPPTSGYATLDNNSQELMVLLQRKASEKSSSTANPKSNQTGNAKTSAAVAELQVKLAEKKVTQSPLVAKATDAGAANILDDSVDVEPEPLRFHAFNLNLNALTRNISAGVSLRYLWAFQTSFTADVLLTPLISGLGLDDLDSVRFTASETVAWRLSLIPLRFLPRNVQKNAGPWPDLIFGAGVWALLEVDHLAQAFRTGDAGLFAAATVGPFIGASFQDVTVNLAYRPFSSAAFFLDGKWDARPVALGNPILDVSVTWTLPL